MNNLRWLIESICRLSGFWTCNFHPSEPVNNSPFSLHCLPAHVALPWRRRGLPGRPTHLNDIRYRCILLQLEGLFAANKRLGPTLFRHVPFVVKSPNAANAKNISPLLQPTKRWEEHKVGTREASAVALLLPLSFCPKGVERRSSPAELSWVMGSAQKVETELTGGCPSVRVRLVRHSH